MKDETIIISVWGGAVQSVILPPECAGVAVEVRDYASPGFIDGDIERDDGGAIYVALHPTVEQVVEPKFRCQDCSGLFSQSELTSASLWQRMEPGDVMPDGDCPKCGAMCFMVPKVTEHDRT